MKQWVNLTEWARLHGMGVVTAGKWIEAGLIGSGNYIHKGRFWRINPEAPILNEVVNLPPKCKDYLRELEAI